jgi:hypothetical protein
MAQAYVIKSVKKGNEWQNSYGTFQSYGLVLDGVGEPVQLSKKVPVNQEPAVGDELYGSLELMTSAKGTNYYKFKSEQRPEAPSEAKSTSTGYQKLGQDPDGMYRCNALNNATSASGPEASKEHILDMAEDFYQWLKHGKQENANMEDPKRPWDKLGKPKDDVVLDDTLGDYPVDINDIAFDT